MTDKAILVTGVTGYIAAHVVKILLEEGYRVRGTVRSIKNTSRIEPLKQLVKNPKHPLELVEVDLTKDDGWDKATEGCETLIHTASPFPNITEKEFTEDEIITPAKEGTLRALKAAVAAGIKKVVLTSSCASVVGTINVDEHKVYSEEDWTDPNDSSIDVYTKSKVLAEKAAWDYQKSLSAEESFDLAVINPSFVLGPVLLQINKSSTSVSIMSQILKGTYPAYPKFAMVVCDVRDVALAHVKAMTNPQAMGKRHIIHNRTMWFRDMAVIVAQEFGQQGYRIPTYQLPYAAAWLMSCFDKQLKNVILPKWGKHFEIGNKNMVEILGITPTPAEKSFIDMCHSLIDLGLVKKTKQYKEPESAPIK